MTYTPQHIANYFLDRAEQDGRVLGHMKVQKLVYIAYGWYLALTGKRLFEEPIQAWQHGPVIRSLYDEFKRFANKGITSRATEINLDTFDEVEPRIDPKDRTLEVILGKVWAAYNRFTGWQLRQKTHEVGTPWSLTYNADERDRVIPDSLIRPHFSDIIKRILDVADASAKPIAAAA